MNSKTLVLCGVLMLILWVVFSANVSKDNQSDSFGYNPGDHFKGIEVESTRPNVFQVYGDKPCVVHFWSIKDAKSRLLNAYLSQESISNSDTYVSVCIDGSKEDMETCLSIDGVNYNHSSNLVFLQMNDYRSLKKDYGLIGDLKTFVVGNNGLIKQVYGSSEAWNLFASNE